jgi:hypothetical protein
MSHSRQVSWRSDGVRRCSDMAHVLSMAIKNSGIFDERRVDLSRRVASRDDLR